MKPNQKTLNQRNIKISQQITSKNTPSPYLIPDIEQITVNSY